jgi:neutral ceramidase
VGADKLYGPTMYTEQNVLMTGTHTHAGPGGYSWHPFYNIPTLGFHEDNFNAVVNGVIAAIQQAHESIKPARMQLNKGILDNSNIKCVDLD